MLGSYKTTGPLHLYYALATRKNENRYGDSILGIGVVSPPPPYDREELCLGVDVGASLTITLFRRSSSEEKENRIAGNEL